MIKSMTGFGNREAEAPHFGKICVELRSSNHKFLDTVLHLPEGLLFLEDKVKREIEARVKRGRITCVITISGGKPPGVSINKPLLKNYVLMLKNIKEEFKIKDEVSISTLMNLPGVFALEENKLSKARIWPHLKILLKGALEGLIDTRKKEGYATYRHLKNRAQALGVNLGIIKIRFKKAIKDKLSGIITDEERAAFLKDVDIAEEIERLSYHIRNFKNKLSKEGPVGKELDFIAQEMQREANTLAAKSFDAVISSRIIQVKSQIEKIREQVQNIE